MGGTEKLSQWGVYLYFQFLIAYSIQSLKGKTWSIYRLNNVMLIFRGCYYWQNTGRLSQV